ncbi:Glycerol-3-phosphate regulon repressor [Caprobacter fermentans]|uniref:Glycerol-3-phosphate regulon repressor n=1 Tax=Caproicibacter fermentans TaxID=2576756 RepID=A0A6N8I0A1_9FIRM|nr:DeoR/GlpR family DNA-binding transcription regulator [Caproicibacter fermentans]MVB11516.1 Glycerol-3-phosphate regulon repressor [Caproicibacter fermentans]OCN02712.1 hypothetical protein A7X67_14170 [Clostridium sp. W14A]
MLSQERVAQILEFINEHGSARVEELASTLNVSEMTIRRDLEKCQKKGLIQRCHGGAVLKRPNEREQPYEDKQCIHQDQKRKIAEICASMIPDGATVYLDAGTTNYQIAERIFRIPDLTVVTNDVMIAAMLHQRDIRLLVVGGEVQNSTGSTLGPFAEQMLRSIRIDLSFMGAASIDPDYNVMTPTIEKAFLKRLVTEISNKSYLAADASKFDRQSMVLINNLKDYAGVVTDRAFTDAEEKQIHDMQINIIPAGTAGEER